MLANLERPIFELGFVPKKTVINKNTLPWIDCEVKYLIKKYTALCYYHMNQTQQCKNNSGDLRKISRI